jgi:hypothetical protein
MLVTADEQGRTLAHKLAMLGQLPVDFSDWQLTDKIGWTVGHEAALYNHLPDGFKQWDLTNKKGWTVAHIVAWNSTLPADFNQWAMIGETEDRATVAHVAAKHCTLPDNFNELGLLDGLWWLSDKNGWTVAHEAAKSKSLLKFEDFDQWGIMDGDGQTVGQVAVKYGTLSIEKHRKWQILNEMVSDGQGCPNLIL